MTEASAADLVVQGPHVLREDLEVLQLMTGAAGSEPLNRAQCDAWRLHEPADCAGVAGRTCAAAGTAAAIAVAMRNLRNSFPLRSRHGDPIPAAI